MKKAWLAVRSALLWVLSGLHFFIVAPSLVFLGIFLDTRKHDWLQRTFCRRIAFLAGARVEVVRSAGNTLFTSGTLGRFSDMLNAVLEAPGEIYHDAVKKIGVRDGSVQVETRGQEK